ncbi:MAG TPA: bifunctional oligoribonuclease/PAP phosphatase NrnA [Thermoanaerobaculia bacterium]|nr:bifunctional oligoribonuclease/PAP phosphatase NrnA [Thermoanaerobaculia bacterium]
MTVEPATKTRNDLALEQTAERIRSGRRFLITSHRNPDGDAIGSALALKWMIESLGKEARVLVRDLYSPPLRHLPGVDEVEIAGTLPPGYPNGVDALFTMECPENERCGYPILPGPVINIDHHVGNTRYGEINFLDLDAPSVGEMLLHLNGILKVPVDRRIATAIYVSLASDTGFFRYTNTTLRAFEAATFLVRSGADPGEISLWLNETVSAAALRLQARCIATLELSHQGRVATMVMPRSFLAEVGATAEEAEGLSSLGRTIDGVLISIFLKEADGGTRVSLRAKPGADVQQIASMFGGGGHKAASGCLIPMGLPEAKAKLLSIISQLFESSPEGSPR